MLTKLCSRSRAEVVSLALCYWTALSPDRAVGDTNWIEVEPAAAPDNFSPSAATAGASAFDVEIRRREASSLLPSPLRLKYAEAASAFS